ncbi:YjzD family protein [Bacillus sp. FJAT-49736]|uniref:YjzD family protein n=1 Tax=Bacillus sp. FJAT-49736 TaxID=2833582 RepID=UPI001BC9D054|nr:YjzD family protein [Bacillus sp. FJAT-49736]MBS4172033.1 YjzD family protein [Bacillus sp. FJAT-49736]
MKYFWTLFWTFLLVHMLGYVGSAMTDTNYSLKDISIISVVVTILILVVSAIIPNSPATEE